MAPNDCNGTVKWLTVKMLLYFLCTSELYCHETVPFPMQTSNKVFYQSIINQSNHVSNIAYPLGFLSNPPVSRERWLSVSPAVRSALPASRTWSSTRCLYKNKCEIAV